MLRARNIFCLQLFEIEKKNSARTKNNVSILHAGGGRQSGKAMRFHEAARSRGSSYIFEYKPQRDEQALRIGLREGLSSGMQKYLRVVAERRLFSCASSCIAPFFPIHPPFQPQSCLSFSTIKIVLIYFLFSTFLLVLVIFHTQPNIHICACNVSKRDVIKNNKKACV